MILPYQLYRNVSGKYLQYPLRFSDDYKINPDGTITIIRDRATTMLDMNTTGYVVLDNDFRGVNPTNGYFWASEEFILKNFELVPPPIFTTQSKVFNHIWETRPHVSQLTGNPLLPKGSMQWHHQFLHILPKGSYPKWKFNEHNILLARPEEHDHQERFPYFLELRQGLTLEYHQKYYGKT